MGMCLTYRPIIVVNKFWLKTLLIHLLPKFGNCETFVNFFLGQNW